MVLYKKFTFKLMTLLIHSAEAWWHGWATGDIFQKNPNTDSDNNDERGLKTMHNKHWF